MRPARLELEGFTAYRERVEIDFTDADLFALVGATGAGKSAIIDAMVFALYGHVPRLDKRAVEPVIAAGKVEARIRFDFTVGDRAFTAARVVRRTKQGATTKEARLEAGESTIAGDADGVTAAVERLLGLTFDQFIKCVVLPQGEFARFLHDTPKGRQELLVRLLDLDVYQRMRTAAGARQKEAEGRLAVIDEQLAQLPDATEEALAGAAARARVLTDLRAAIDELAPELDTLAERRRAAQARADEAAQHVRILEGVRQPPDVAVLAQRAVAAAAALEQARKVQADTERTLGDAEARLDGLGDRAVLERLRTVHERRAELAARKERGEPIVAQVTAAERTAAQQRADADAAHRGAQETVARLERAHAAHALAGTLVVGEPCPVCDQPVHELPDVEPQADLDAARRQVEQARRALAEAEQTLADARDARAKAEQTMADIATEIADIEQRLAGQPGTEQVAASLAAIAGAEQAVRDARAAASAARGECASRAEQAEAAEAQRDGAWEVFDRARDQVAACGPPEVDRRDLAAAWNDLESWARTEVERRREAGAQAGKEVQAIDAERAAREEVLTRRCEEADVAVPAGRPRDVVTEALARAEARVEQVTRDIDRAKALRADRSVQSERAGVASVLFRHLSSTGFERWLLDEALEQLALGASDVLRDLSAGQYSLAIDPTRNFSVVDHRNADERRPARTLSGGETFLASLALALTLAEHLAAMAVDTQPRLESIFLDEGFGTLDADTLDVVATSIEELGSRGRTVGLVTHVRELAERVPVRFEVRKTPSGATVDRVVV